MPIYPTRSPPTHTIEGDYNYFDCHEQTISKDEETKIVWLEVAS